MRRRSTSGPRADLHSATLQRKRALAARNRALVIRRRRTCARLFPPTRRWSGSGRGRISWPLQSHLHACDLRVTGGEQALDDCVTNNLCAKSPTTARSSLERTNFEQAQEILLIVDFLIAHHVAPASCQRVLSVVWQSQEVNSIKSTYLRSRMPRLLSRAPPVLGAVSAAGPPLDLPAAGQRRFWPSVAPATQPELEKDGKQL